MEDEIEDHLEKVKAEYEEKIYFMNQSLGAEVHWFFYEGLAAFKADLYLAACSSFLIAIEASLRVTMAQIEKPAVVEELDPVKTLSNRLLVDAKENGLPVELLSFHDEPDFGEKLKTRKPTLRNVRIVEIRHNLCHGNILSYVNSDLGENNKFFVPSCCRDVALELYVISRRWAKALGDFRKTVLNA